MKILIKTHFLIIIIFAITAAGCAKSLTEKVRDIERERIIPSADKYLNEEPITVTASFSPRSAGGKHDFFSEGDYWWPNPKHPDSPYVRRDGMTNPDNFVAHRKAMVRFSIQSATLTAAYKITGDLKYAQKALEHIRAWFVDEETKMNPHLLYAQAIKGICTGRGVGIIDTIHLIEVAQSIIVLEKAGIIDPASLAAIKKWFRDYYEWMTTHPYGVAEMNAANNHGTCWVMQVASFAKLVGDEDKMEFCRKRFKEILLPKQMGQDGSFPHELTRTKPYNYSLFNLDAMTTICQILSTEQDNLWEFTLEDGRNIKKGVEFIAPYIADKSKWPYEPDVMYFEHFPTRQTMLLFASIAYDEPKYFDIWKTLSADPDNEEVIRNTPLRQPILWIE